MVTNLFLWTIDSIYRSTSGEFGAQAGTRGGGQGRWGASTRAGTEGAGHTCFGGDTNPGSTGCSRPVCALISQCVCCLSYRNNLNLTPPGGFITLPLTSATPTAPPESCCSISAGRLRQISLLFTILKLGSLVWNSILW